MLSSARISIVARAYSALSEKPGQQQHCKSESLEFSNKTGRNWPFERFFLEQFVYEWDLLH